MTICTKDGGCSVNCGLSTVWESFISLLRDKIKNFNLEYPNVNDFLSTFMCSSYDSAKTALQLQTIMGMLSRIPLEGKAFSTDKTRISCADYFTTVDGDNLLSKLIELLEYSARNHTDVIPCF